MQLGLWALPIYVVASVGCGQALAIYRCGNVFQDTPCDHAAQPLKVVPGGGGSNATQSTASSAASTKSSASPFAAECSRLGGEAQKIVWKREAGATQERQLAELQATGNGTELAGVIESVYRKRGTAPEIRAAYEAECAVNKQKAADAVATLKALQEAARAAAPIPAASVQPSAGSATVVQSTPTGANAASGASGLCPGLKQQLESIKAQARAGGSAATMERLNEDRRKLERLTSDAKCT